MDFTEYSVDILDCKNIGGFCNFTHFQTWYCEWKEMDLFGELCPLPSLCCVPKTSKWEYLRSFMPWIKRTFCFLFVLLLLILIGIFIAKLAKRFVAKQGRMKATNIVGSCHTFSTSLAMQTWAVKALIKLLPTVPKKELKIGAKISEDAWFTLHKAKLRDASMCLKAMKCQNDHFDTLLNEAALCWHIRLSAPMFNAMPSLHICHFNGICQLRPDQFGIVLEWTKLGSVQTLLNAQSTSSSSVKQLQDKDLLRIATQISTGLYQLHTLLIIHGNICARNCLLSGDPSKPDKLIAKLSDFGNSQMVSTKNDIYECWPTARQCWPYKWMAPECFAIREQEKYQLSLHSDIWSFGAFLLELFSLGAEPFPTMDPSEAKSMLLMDPKMNALNFNDNSIPNDVKRIIRKCFAVAPKDRPKAENLIKLLQQCQF